MAWFYAMNLFWQIIPSTEITEILCSGKMDGVVIDAEHGSFTIQNIVDSIRVITLKGKKAFVRLKENQRIEQISVDNGCDGLIYSTVERLIKPKWGIGLTRKNNYGQSKLTGKAIVRVAQIETVAGLLGLSKSVSFNKMYGYDYYMLTPYDFSNSIGLPGQFNSAEYLDCDDKFKAIVPAEKRACHIVKDIESQTEKYKDYGLKCYGLDSLMILDTVKGLDKYV